MERIVPTTHPTTGLPSYQGAFRARSGKWHLVHGEESRAPIFYSTPQAAKSAATYAGAAWRIGERMGENVPFPALAA